MVDLPDLHPGTSRSGLVCPACLGGRTGERSFSVTRHEDGTVWYKCHRSTCGYRGRYGAITPISVSTTPFTPRPYPYRLVAPRSDHWIWQRVGFNEIAAPGASNAVLGGSMAGVSAKLGLGVREEDPNEIVWEVRDLDLQPLGSVSRRYPEKRIKTWRERPGPWFGLFRLDPSASTLWIVEDPVSAARIALAGSSALCLFGTHLSLDGRHALTEYLKSRPGLGVRVALDPDASAIGMDLTKVLTLWTGSDILFVPLKQDIKDLSHEDFFKVVKQP